MLQTQEIILLSIVLVSFAVIIFNFILLVTRESNNVVFLQVQVQSLRIAGILPLFGALFLLKFIFAKYDTFIDIGVSFFEAYCLYSFYKMQILYLGSHNNVLEALRHTKHHFLCGDGWETDHPERVLQISHAMLLQFLFVRPFFVLAQGVLELFQHSRSSPLFILFTVLQLLSTVLGLGALLRLSLALAHATERLRAMRKLAFLKVIVLVIIVENVVANALISNA